MKPGSILTGAAMLLAALAPGFGQEAPQRDDAIAAHERPALPEGFDRLPYASDHAVEGGRLRLAFLGAFDSLNPYNVKALSTAQGLIGNVYQSLMFRSADEPFTLYGLIARRIETDAAREHVTFRLDPRAHFSDGTPITSADVVFTFRLLREKGRPQQRAAYALVKSIDAPDAETVRYDLSGANDRELPLTLAMMPVLSVAHTDAAHFEDQTLAIPLGSGPYVVGSVEPGRGLTLERDPDYWARGLPLMRGLYNFDEIRIDYYRDPSALFEAFKAGLYDFRVEDDATRWRAGYDFPAARDGRIVREAIGNSLPKGVSGFAFNTRRPLFAKVETREALASMFDFEWIDANLYGGAYRRSKGFFDDSGLSSIGRPASAAERALLAHFPGAVREDVLEGRWAPPVSDGSGRDPKIERRALDEFGKAGFRLRGGALADNDGRRLSFEILVKNREEERLALAYARSLARIGVVARVRVADEVQFQRRRDAFDFDVIIGSWLASPSPGAEQRGRWSTDAASMQGSYNLAGVHSRCVDAMIAALLAARTHEAFVDGARALDRALISGFYITPLFYAPEQWIAYSARLARPSRTPLFGVDLDAWWSRPS